MLSPEILEIYVRVSSVWCVRVAGPDAPVQHVRADPALRPGARPDGGRDPLPAEGDRGARAARHPHRDEDQGGRGEPAARDDRRLEEVGRCVGGEQPREARQQPAGGAERRTERDRSLPADGERRWRRGRRRGWRRGWGKRHHAAQQQCAR